MKREPKYSNLNLFVLIAFILFFGADTYAQFGGGQMGRGGMNGRQRSAIPQAQTPPEPPKPKTADEIVEEQMPRITEALELNVFENAVVSAILKKYVQQRIEAQILQLEPQKMKEVYQKIAQDQDEELKAGLPEEKYEAFQALQKEGLSKALKKKKKEKKQKKKKTKTNR